MASHPRPVNVVGRWSAVTFLAAAICFVVVLALRWWGACQWGDFESTACFERQDDRWDDALRDAPGLAPELAAQAGGYILFGSPWSCSVWPRGSGAAWWPVSCRGCR